MNRKIKVADGKSGREVANGTPGQKHSHAVGTRGLANLCQRILLSGRQAALEKINVIGHA